MNDTTEVQHPTDLQDTSDAGAVEDGDADGIDALAPVGGYQPPTTPPLLTGGTGGSGRAGAGRPGPSVPTVLWGLLLALVAAGAIVHQVSDVDINFAVAAPIALLAFGGALVIWGVAGLGRKAR